ncbi:MAG: amidohydrolase [Comamonadaceae bacterium]|nr:MAG: amidohydrolase [Comamonadaceae bacterium]
MSAPIASGGWDCHAHVFGPYRRYPLAEGRNYTPPEALQADYLALLARLGLTHGVLVQPSAYGEDHTLLLDTLSALPQLRGVVVMQAAAKARLAGLRDKGVRAARFSHRSGAANFHGSASFDDLLQMAPALAEADLHAELWTDCKALPAIASQLRDLPVPVVIDHMGGFDVEAGIDDPGFRTLLSLLESGKVWVKLCVYRNLPGNVDPERGRSFHEAMLHANDQRLVWGSDWPHLRVSPAPDSADLLQTFRDWTPAVLAEDLLRHNPARLYG